MKAFITGGAGFIGSHLTRKLLKEGHTVCVYDNLSSGRKEFIDELFKIDRFKFIMGDLLDIKKLFKSISGYDTVFHLSSNPDIAKGIKETDLDLKQGIIATYNVLEVMRRNNIKKIIYISGSGVYGDAGHVFTPEDFGPLIPVSMYGASKLSCEAIISAFCHMFNIKAWIFRLANVVGARQTHGVIFDFIKKLKKNPSELEILGNGKQSKSYIHVSDVLSAIFLCLKKASKKVNIYNVATNDYITVKEIADMVVKKMGLKNVKYKYTGGKCGWKGDVPIVRLDIKKIEKLGWKAKLTSFEAVEKAIEENLYLCRQ